MNDFYTVTYGTQIQNLQQQILNKNVINSLIKTIKLLFDMYLKIYGSMLTFAHILKAKMNQNFPLNHIKFGLSKGSCMTVHQKKPFFFFLSSSWNNLLQVQVTHVHLCTVNKARHFFQKHDALQFGKCFFPCQIIETTAVHLHFQKVHYKTIDYLQTFKGESVAPAVDTAHPAGLVQDCRTVVACPAPLEPRPSRARGHQRDSKTPASSERCQWCSVKQHHPAGRRPKFNSCAPGLCVVAEECWLSSSNKADTAEGVW